MKYMGVYYSFEKKNKTATMFFLNKPYLVFTVGPTHCYLHV